MITRIRKFLALPASRKKLLLEITLGLLRAAWQVRRAPFQTYSKTLGRPVPGDFVDTALTDIPVEPLRDVRWALKRINALAGGRFTCLMLAMAGKRALDRRGLANSLVLGARPDQGDGDDPFGAHAWLRAGPFVVIGAEESVGHIPLVSYHSAQLG